MGRPPKVTDEQIIRALPATYEGLAGLGLEHSHLRVRLRQLYLDGQVDCLMIGQSPVWFEDGDIAYVRDIAGARRPVFKGVRAR